MDRRYGNGKLKKENPLDLFVIICVGIVEFPVTRPNP